MENGCWLLADMKWQAIFQLTHSNLNMILSAAVLRQSNGSPPQPTHPPPPSKALRLILLVLKASCHEQALKLRKLSSYSGR